MKRLIFVTGLMSIMSSQLLAVQLKGSDARNLFEELPIEPVVLCKKNNLKENQELDNLILKTAVEKKVYFGFRITPTELDNIRNQEQNSNTSINKRTRCIKETYETDGQIFNRFNCEIEFVPVAGALDTYSSTCD